MVEAEPLTKVTGEPMVVQPPSLTFTSKITEPVGVAPPPLTVIDRDWVVPTVVEPEGKPEDGTVDVPLFTVSVVAGLVAPL